MQIKEVHEIKDFEKPFVKPEGQNSTVYLTWKKMDTGEQKRIWGGIFKKVYTRDSEEYGMQRSYVFKSSTGDFVIGSTKLVDDRLKAFRIGDYVRVEYKGRKPCSTGEKAFKYVDFEFCRSSSGSLRGEDLTMLIEEVKKETEAFSGHVETPQPYPEYLIAGKMIAQHESDVPF